MLLSCQPVYTIFKSSKLFQSQNNHATILGLVEIYLFDWHKNMTEYEKCIQKLVVEMWYDSLII